MLNRLLGRRRVAQINRAIRNGKITFLCLVMTVVVLRGMIGVGHFGTTEQDVVLLRSNLSNNRRVLEEVKQSFSSSGGTAAKKADKNPNSYEAFEINRILGDEEPEEEKDPNKPYSLGPRISNWDEQRSKWLKGNPQFPNFLKPNKPRVLLVTGSSPKPCENPVGDHYLLKSIKNKIDYCRIHGIEIFYNMAVLDPGMAGFWANLP